MIETIVKLVQVAPTFKVTENGGVVHNYFEKNKEAESAVVVDCENPVGILMRNDFYKKIGRRFGYDLYMRRDISLIMKTDILCVDISCDMAKFGFITMNRSRDSIYDDIIVLDHEKYLGVVSISQYLIEMSKTKEHEIELLNNQQLILRQANEAEKLHSMAIEQKNTSIKNLMDNAGQGFLSFGSDLIVSEEHSKACDEIFGYSICKKSILEIFRGSVNEDIIHLMENTFENVFLEQDKKRNKIYLSILPQEILINNNYVKIEYKVIDNRSDKSVMLILTDVTANRALELKNLEEKNNVKLIIRAISCQTEINQAISDLRELFKTVVPNLLNSVIDKKKAIYSAYRMIHTMKGDISLNSLHHTSEQLHQLEDLLAEIVSLEDFKQVLNKISCDDLLREDMKIITEAIGSQYFEKQDTFTVSKKRLSEIQGEIKGILSGCDQEIILRLLDSLLYSNVKDIIANYNDYTREVAEGLGKIIGEFKITGDDVYINREKYIKFTKSLVHIFRNLVDHGIESPDERIGLGKPEYGEITCHIEKYEDKFSLNIADDGKGIDCNAIRKKALEKRLFTESEIDNLSREEILEIIFLDNFSTRNTVSMLSGRGVGLAAVRSELDDLGGTIKVDTQTGKYTSFELIVPV
jgi:two-component system chemotaxis sensor kinase CheA